jgi:hypothetical protein
LSRGPISATRFAGVRNLAPVIQRRTAIFGVDKDMDSSVEGHVKRLLKSNPNATVVNIKSWSPSVSADDLRGVDKLYFVAHGFGPDIVGDWSAKELQDMLLTEETKPLWNVKQFILVSCNAANQEMMKEGKPIAEELHEGLSAHVTPFTLLGFSGYGYTDHLGRHRVVPHTKNREHLDKVKALEPLKATNPGEFAKRGLALLDEYAPLGSGLVTYGQQPTVADQDDLVPLLSSSSSSQQEEESTPGCWPFWPFSMCFSK